MIDEIYIKEAVRIREEYLNNLVYLAKEEENIKELTKELNQIAKDVEDSDAKGEKYYRDALFEVELTIRKATDKVIPYYDKTKELDKQQKNLYDTIKDKYPNISDEEMKKEIIPHIIKVDDKYRKKYGEILK
jgi:uncharacterized protein YhaN